MDNSTYPYHTENLQGHTSFEFYPFHQDQKHTCYKGMHFSTNRIDQTRVLVRTSTGESFSNNDVKDMLLATKYAETYLEGFFKQYYIKEFLCMCRMTHSPVSFGQPVVTRLASTARCLNRFFKVIRGHHKILKKDEWVFIERRLLGEYVSFVDEKGHRTKETDGKEQGRTYCDFERLLSAFCHYTLVSSGQTLVVCGLTGVHNGQHTRLSIPCVHSVDQTFGAEDQGTRGIENFVKNHKCNALCKHLSLLTDNRKHKPRYNQSDKATGGMERVFGSAQVAVYSGQA
ncbi:uncharacterized protein LOC110466763 isoform X2 [Mizuhopecten yessoensis]|uniref:Transient receptor potential cation channel subfamily M member 6 n=2 Tax=Mizuhopecten yessoensis TaxID=6573 RepID=A0A210PNC8_MIZYE|nr:uncharacterized protein LOC110466763 isoform X2 [Mizuhopecten yessoensis]OWF37991.1 Transient receptor potential cation channel subfamily M member 6 [Mizuhopecten yessoensis]